MDTMERILEGKSRQARKEKRESKSRSRDSRRVSQAHNVTPSRSRTPQLMPGTPHHYKYYSERVIGEASTSQIFLDVVSNAAPETPRRSTRTAAFKAPGSRLPKTPVNRHILSQPSSSHTSTPQSSPARIVNIVSSPGPMRDAPDSEEDELDDLPYTLPPGPYSKEKPDFSYAALIGQAILSSPEHRLTLQDIYEWITTVYPYYTRGEQTWMNSIRHSLSTMAVFRKITRGRNEGKSLWAIWDCDIPCFANGGFRKSLCADMAKPKQTVAKSGPKRKPAMDDTLTRDGKRRKRSENDMTAKSTPFSTSSYPAPILPPFYAPMYANAQQQPYYQPYVPVHPPPAPVPVPVAAPIPAQAPAPTPAPTAVSAESLFPPLPPTSAYHRAMSMSRPSSAVVSRASSVETGPVDTVPSSTQPASPEPSKAKPPTSSSSSMPELTSSSSSASSPPLSSVGSTNIGDLTTYRTPGPSAIDHEDEVDKLTAQWLASPGTIDALTSGFTLKASHDKPKTPVKGSARSKKGFPFTVPEAPESPTTARRTIGKGKQPMRPLSPMLMYPTPDTVNLPRSSTPPTRPCTPPRKRTVSGNIIQLSPQRTPISHRGLHMSPSPSLAHYKSNLDPPPAAVFLPQAPLLSGMLPPEDSTLTLPAPRTPSRKRTTPNKGGSGSKVGIIDMSPFTPKRLFGGVDSPFRTPSSHLLDPYNPATLLEDEINRLNSQEFGLHDSPDSSLFGKRGSMYGSPGLPSPSRYW